MSYKPKDKPLTLARLSEIYESCLPEMTEERDRQIKLLRGGLDDTPAGWWPEWDENQAEDTYLRAVKLRDQFDPELEKAKRWAVIAIAVKGDSKAHRLQRFLHQAHNRVLEILTDVKDLTSLAIAVCFWNYVAERLIELSESDTGSCKGD